MDASGPLHNLSAMASRVGNQSTFAATGMNGQAYAKVSAFFLPLVGASAHMQTRKAPKTFHHLLSLRNAHFTKSTSRYSRVDSSNSLAHPQFV